MVGNSSFTGLDKSCPSTAHNRDGVCQKSSNALRLIETRHPKSACQRMYAGRWQVLSFCRWQSPPERSCWLPSYLVCSNLPSSWCFTSEGPEECCTSEGPEERAHETGWCNFCDDDNAEFTGLHRGDLREPLFAFPAGYHDHDGADGSCWSAKKIIPFTC